MLSQSHQDSIDTSTRTTCRPSSNHSPVVQAVPLCPGSTCRQFHAFFLSCPHSHTIPPSVPANRALPRGCHRNHSIPSLASLIDAAGGTVVVSSVLAEEEDDDDAGSGAEAVAAADVNAGCEEAAAEDDDDETSAAVSHTRTTPSSAAVAISEPSWLNAQSLTESEWPLSSAMLRRVR